MMTPRAFYFMYWKYHPFRFAHERPALSPQQKRDIFLTSKELRWWTELLIGFVITHEKHCSDTLIQTQSNFFKIMASLISSDVNGFHKVEWLPYTRFAFDTAFKITFIHKYEYLSQHLLIFTAFNQRNNIKH